MLEICANYATVMLRTRMLSRSERIPRDGATPLTRMFSRCAPSAVPAMALARPSPAMRVRTHILRQRVLVVGARPSYPYPLAEEDGVKRNRPSSASLIKEISSEVL